MSSDAAPGPAASRNAVTRPGRGLQFHHGPRAIAARSSSAFRSSAFTVGHVASSQVVAVIERIRSASRSHGNRNGMRGRHSIT